MELLACHGTLRRTRSCRAHAIASSFLLTCRALKHVPLVKLDAVDDVMKLFTEGEGNRAHTMAGAC